MKALILNGSAKSDPLADQISSSLTGELAAQSFESTLLNLADIEIAPCLGCFGCWVKTPGTCVIADFARDIAKIYMQSELVVFISPITFGGYSYEVKKVFDRMIPILSPFFKKMDGEIHHKMRYKRYPHFLVIGLLPEPDPEQEEIFTTLTARNARNIAYQSWASAIFYAKQTDDELKSEVHKLFAKVGGA